MHTYYVNLAAWHSNANVNWLLVLRSSDDQWLKANDSLIVQVTGTFCHTVWHASNWYAYCISVTCYSSTSWLADCCVTFVPFHPVWARFSWCWMTTQSFWSLMLKSLLSGFQRCCWQYWSIFIRLRLGETDMSESREILRWPWIARSSNFRSWCQSKAHLQLPISHQ